MKCDIVIYSEDTAIGLFYFAKWGYEGSFVMFIYNTADLSEKSMEEIKSQGVYCVKDDALASKIADQHRAGEALSDSFLEPVAKIYREFLKQTALPENKYVEYFRTRKIAYTELAKCSQPDMIREIIRNLKESDDEDDRIQAFECEKLLKNQEVRRSSYLMIEKEKKALLFKHVECCAQSMSCMTVQAFIKTQIMNGAFLLEKPKTARLTGKANRSSGCQRHILA